MFPLIRCSSAWLLAALVLMLASALAVQAASPQLPLHHARSSPGDLAVGGDLLGLPHGEVRFVRFADLLALPQQTFTAAGDSNFGRPVRISGIPLEHLPELLHAAPGARMVTALCSDDYKANYPEAYLRTHHPVLVLLVDGQPPAGWPHYPHGPAMGPFMISHRSFTPAFQVLAHKDEPQIPWGVVRLDVRLERNVYAPIQPIGSHAHDVEVQQGFTVARQNCFRCHNEGAEGGMKAGRSWPVVARRSVTDPQYFNSYVHGPKKLNPASRMAASPEYDAATLAALRAYFQPFADLGDSSPP